MNEPKTELESLLQYYPTEEAIHKAWSEKDLNYLLVAMHNLMAAHFIIFRTYQTIHPMINRLIADEKELERRTHLND